MKTFAQYITQILSWLFALQLAFGGVALFVVYGLAVQSSVRRTADHVSELDSTRVDQLVLQRITGNQEAFDFSIYDLIQTKKLDYAGFIAVDGLRDFLRNRNDFSGCSEQSLLSQGYCMSEDFRSAIGIIPLVIDRKTLGFVIQETSLDQTIVGRQNSSILTAGIVLMMSFLVNIAGIFWFFPRKLHREISTLHRLVHPEERENFTDVQVSISELDEIAQALRQAAKARKKSERMDAILMTTQMLAHDIRKPFSMIRAGLAMLENTKTKNDFSRVKSLVVGQLNSQEKTASELLDDLLEIGRKVKPRVASFELAPVIDEALSSAIAHSGNQSTPIIKDFHHSGLAFGDSAKLGRVFANILGNALEALDNQEGEVRVATRDHLGDSVAIVIGNSGSHIPAGLLDDIFDPFFSKGKASGTGLGLAVAKKIVDDHQGSISVASNEEENRVEFRIVLLRNMGALEHGVEA